VSGTSRDELIAAYVDNDATEQQRHALEELLLGDAVFAERFVREVHIEALLEHRAAAGEPGFGSGTETQVQAKPPTISPRLTVLGTFIGVTLLVLLAFFPSTRRDATDEPVICELSASNDVSWSAPPPNAITGGEELVIDRGRVAIRFQDGTEAIALGPAELVVVSEHLIALRRGTVTVDVKPASKKKFRVSTPTTRVLDIGTRFGVSVPEEQVETEVVVFEGAVELERTDETAWERPQILFAGDSVLVSPGHRLHRVMSVRYEKYHQSAVQQSVFRDIKDNLSSTRRAYRLVPGGMGEDALAYVDRMDEWNGIDGDGMPEFLVGADYIMPFVDEHQSRDFRLEVVMDQDSYLYLLVDSTLETPEWISKAYADTGHSVGLDQGYTLDKRLQTGAGPGDSVDRAFRIYRRTVSKGERVVLGDSTEEDGHRLMYGICAAPIERPQITMPGETSSAIVSIRDNVRGSEIKGYHVFLGGMGEDALAYADRLHEWNGIGATGMPGFLRGADVITTHNDDRFIRGYELSVVISEDTEFFVLWEDRVAPRDWLLEGFDNTGERVGLDEGLTPRAKKDKSGGPGHSIDATFSVWRRVAHAGDTVKFGAIGTADRHTNMYGICLRSLPDQPHEGP